MKPIVIVDASDDENRIPFQLPGGKTVKLLRLDFLDEETVDQMNVDLLELDVEEQLVAVANDIASAKVKTVLQWQPLLDGTKEKLSELGVEITRVVDKDGRRDDVKAASDDVVEALKPFSERKPRSMRKRAREVSLTMLKYVVDEDELALFEPLRLGQLEQILGEWRKHSKVELGE